MEIGQQQVGAGDFAAWGDEDRGFAFERLDAPLRVHRRFEGETSIFITPGHKITSADLLLTNFHLPKSTLFMLVCAFAGQDRMRAAYAHAIATGYRFYSYGDACLLERA